MDMKKTEIRALVIALILAILGAPVLPGLFQVAPPDIQTMAEGDTNFTNVVASGDITAGDDIVAGGDLTASGAFSVDTTGAITLDADAASNFNTAGAGINLTLESEAGRLILKGDEAAANGITIDANDAVTTGLDIDVGSVSGMTIDGGLTDIGGGSCDVATGDNDLCVADAVEIDGELELDGALDADSTANIAGATIFGSTIDIASTVNFGTDNLYPLGYASADQQIECGVTATFTDTVAVTASALTTATYAIATQITDPLASAAFLTVDAPAANVFNIDSWENDYTVGTTGVTVFWCAVGPQ